MRISCPHCGLRDVREFTYLGDAAPERPDPQAPDAINHFMSYVYMRDNPRGLHREFWYHVAGCHSWLIVTRDTMSHEITRVEFACDAASGRSLTGEGG